MDTDLDRLNFYRAFHSFRQAKIANGGLILGLSRFSLLPQLPYKMMLDSKVVKIDSKIIIRDTFCSILIGFRHMPIFFNDPAAFVNVVHS